MCDSSATAVRVLSRVCLTGPGAAGWCGANGRISRMLSYIYNGHCNSPETAESSQMSSLAAAMLCLSGGAAGAMSTKSEVVRSVVSRAPSHGPILSYNRVLSNQHHLTDGPAPSPRSPIQPGCPFPSNAGERRQCVQGRTGPQHSV